MILNRKPSLKEPSVDYLLYKFERGQHIGEAKVPAANLHDGIQDKENQERKKRDVVFKDRSKIGQRETVQKRNATVPKQQKPKDTVQKPYDIFDAASAGDLESVKDFISNKLVPIDSRFTGSGETPLIKAVQGGHFKVMEYLVNAGASINQTDKWGYSCLLWAVDQKNVDMNMIRYLVSYGADVKLQDKKKGYAAVHWAAVHDDLALLKYLIEQGADVNVRSVNGETPIDLAAQNSSLNVIDFLFGERGIHYDMYIAAAKGYTDVVGYFIDRRGKLVDSTDSSGWTALHKAAHNGHLGTVKFLVDEKGAKVNIDNKLSLLPLTPLHAAADKGYIDIVKYLVQKGADINRRDVNGRTPLYWAADFSHLDVVKFFVDDMKADINQVDNDLNTLLHAATWNGHLNVVKYLVEQKGFNVNLKNKYGFTPIIEAIMQSKIHIFQYLLHVPNIDVRIADNNGIGPLHYAAEKGFLEIIKSLVDKGADVNGKQRDGRTPLYRAAGGSPIFGGRLNIVRYFIEEKMCDPFQKDDFGNSLLHAAGWNGGLDVIMYLVEEKGLDVNVKDNDGNTPLAEAIERNKTAVAEYLQSKGARRNRRSVDVHNFGRKAYDTMPDAVELSASNTAASKTNFWLNGVTGFVRNSISCMVLPSATNSHRFALNGKVTDELFFGSLTLFNIVVRKFTGNSYEQSVHTSLLSPEKLIIQRIDPDAITATEKLSETFDQMYSEMTDAERVHPWSSMKKCK